MAPVRAVKARSKPASAREQSSPGRAKGGTQSNGSLPQRVATLERERDALKDELRRTQAQLRKLEETHSQVRDRIAWALDSLQSILESKR